MEFKFKRPPAGGYNYQRFLVYMKPQEYLDQARNEVMGRPENADRLIYHFEPYDNVVAKYKKALTEGRVIDLPRLGIEDAAENVCPQYGIPSENREGGCKLKLTGKGRPSWHEGRHRATASRELGLPEIPVQIEAEGLKNWFENEKIYNRPDLQEQMLINAGITAQTEQQHDAIQRATAKFRAAVLS